MTESRIYEGDNDLEGPPCVTRSLYRQTVPPLCGIRVGYEFIHWNWNNNNCSVERVDYSKEPTSTGRLS